MVEWYGMMVIRRTDSSMAQIDGDRRTDNLVIQNDGDRRNGGFNWGSDMSEGTDGLVIL